VVSKSSKGERFFIVMEYLPHDLKSLMEDMPDVCLQNLSCSFALNFFCLAFYSI
jgi:hypothetical protein